MEKIFGQSWLTTVIGILGALLRLITAYSQTGTITPSDLADASTYVAMGAAAKTFNVSGSSGASQPK
jgi:hypothetical protein